MWTFRSQEAMENPKREYKERTMWDPHVEPLLDLATETESQDLLVEVRKGSDARTEKKANAHLPDPAREPG